MNEHDAIGLLDQLLDLDAAARAARLAELAATDPELAETLQRWLAADGRDEPRIDRGLVRTLIAPVSATSGIAAGDRVGAYCLVRELGRGGMGQVWLAERADGEFAQQVALKLINPDLASPEAAPRFRRERQILAGLRHPNIAQLLDGGVTPDGRPWLAMEWVEGQSLREEVRRGPVSPRRVLMIGAQIAEALAHAHVAGVVHRDLKPENVMVARDGYAKVLDFGIAKMLRDESSGGANFSATQPGMLLGTVAYMSPEQASGQVVDFRSDQFALGAVLYELATGKAAFARDTQSATLTAVLASDPVALDGTQPNLPPALAQVLRRCLAKDPNERYAATLDLAHDLKAVQSGSLTSGPVAPLRAHPRARWFGAMALGAAAALLLAGAWWMLRPEPRAPSAPTSLVRAELSIAPATALWYGAAPLHLFALSPDGRNLAFAGIRDKSRMLYVRALDTRTARVLPGSEGGSNPVFSPDGEWLAFYANQKLKKIPVSGGGATILAEAPNALSGIAWPAPDRIIYTPHPSSGLSQVSAAGGEPTVLTVPDVAAGESSHGWPDFVTDTDVVVYAAEMEKEDSFDAARIYALDVKTGQRTLLVDGGSDPRVVDGTLYYARAGTIYAAPLDAERRVLKGSPKPLYEGVVNSTMTGSAQFAAGAGVTVHLPGTEGGKLEPVIVDRSGKEQSIGMAPDFYGPVRISPDGRHAVFQISAADEDLWSYDFERRALSRVTDFGENFHPAWTPDGKSIIYSHHQTPTPPAPTLYRRRADGSGESELLLTSAAGIRARLHIDVSPDGRSVVYAQYTVEHNFDLWLFDSDGGENREWVSTPNADIQPRFSPDGRWIAYSSFVSFTGGGQVYVQSVSGEAQRWQVTNEGGSGPAWRRDGRELLFYRQGTIFAVELAAGDDLAPSAPRALFSGDYISIYDVFPDGERFLMLKRIPDPARAGPILLDVPVVAPARD